MTSQCVHQTRGKHLCKETETSVHAAERLETNLFSLVKVNFSDSTAKSQKQSDEVKYQHWVRVEYLLVDVGRSPMEVQVRVRAESELRRIFPCLKAFVIQQVVKRLPVVKRLITVGYV
jgi:hypothetical protein